MFMQEPQVALLPPGAAVVYDGRLLHCGTGNASRRQRAQLVLTVRPCGCGVVASASRKTRRAFPENVTLEELKMGRRIKG
jgi:ectoine hydroxylase-related dioxygenase (phytanoyl-CoA dioxygenase family)